MSERTPSQPNLAELTARYLKDQSANQVAGLGKADFRQEVTPFDAGPVQTVDPAAAWHEATAALPFFRQVDCARLKTPPDWPQLVALQPPAVALAFCVGNYPQLLRDLHLLRQSDLAKLRLADCEPLDGATVTDWAREMGVKHRFPSLLVVLGTLRLARQYQKAADLIHEHAAIADEWRPAWENERAALAWHSGHAQEALEQWRKQDPSVPVLFNRGMAALFLGKAAEAATPLREAVAQLPDTSGWHHLAQLYLALCRAF